MKKIRFGIICPSDIAMRRFLPAAKSLDQMEFIGVGINSVEERYGEHRPKTDVVESMLFNERKRAEDIVRLYGGRIFNSYQEIVTSPEIDAMYIPLPPALHYKWAKKALECNKHVLVEKPATINLENTDELISIAQSKKLALHENYMFVFHNQIKTITDIINSGEIGEVRLYRISFGFPLRENTDFRYNKLLGGGSLLDAGGYTIKLASYLLGDTAKIMYAFLNNLDTFEVDMYGSGALINNDGVTAQIAFGMDNDYKCELEVWGNKGTLYTGRVLTAPAGFEPSVIIKKNGTSNTIDLPSDDAFKKSIEKFLNCIEDSDERENNYSLIHRQAENVQAFIEMTKKEVNNV